MKTLLLKKLNGNMTLMITKQYDDSYNIYIWWEETWINFLNLNGKLRCNNYKEFKMNICDFTLTGHR